MKPPLIKTSSSHPEEVHELRKENVKLLQLLRIFHENLATALDLKTFFRRCYEIVPLISKLLDVNRISLLLCDEGTQSLINHELVGEEYSPEQLRSNLHPIGYSISGKCLELERPIVVEDCSQTDLIPQEWIEKLNLKSTLAVPIRVKQKVIGVMRIDNTERIHRFSELEIEFFSTLADQLGIMIENARLFTEHKQAEQALRESEERFRNIVGSSPIGVFTYELQPDQRLVLIGANPATDRILGLKCSQLIGKRIEQAFPPLANTELPERFRWVAEKGDPWECDHFPYTGEKDNGIFEIRAFQISPGKMAVMFLDITKRKQAEEAMHRTSRLEVTTTLAGGIAHEFNNLMVGVLGNAELLKMKITDRPDLENSLLNICDAAQRAGQLAQQMLAYARGGKYMSEQLSLNDFIHEILRHQERSFPSRIRVNCILEPKLWSLEADPTQMSQVITNLCINAVESIEDQGEITIKTHNLEVREYFPHEYPDLKPGRYVSLSIEDTGCGMDSAIRSKVFEPFFTTKFRGRGLGLAAVYGIVRNHGGVIKVSSQVGRGSKFEVFLPALLTKKKDSYSLELTTSDQAGAETVLVIDDDMTVLSVARDILESLGYKVLIASGGKKAIQIAREHPESIDVALLDMWMPYMRGLEVYPYLKEARPDLKVILCSGYDLDESAQALLDAGAESFLSKPYRIEDLSREIQKALVTR